MSDKALWDEYVKAEKAIIALKDRLAEAERLLRHSIQDDTENWRTTVVEIGRFLAAADSASDGAKT